MIPRSSLRVAAAFLTTPLIAAFGLLLIWPRLPVQDISQIAGLVYAPTLLVGLPMLLRLGPRAAQPLWSLLTGALVGAVTPAFAIVIIAVVSGGLDTDPPLILLSLILAVPGVVLGLVAGGIFWLLAFAGVRRPNPATPPG